MVISGRVQIPRSASVRIAKAVWVRVLDVSRADAPSQIVAEHRLHDVEVKAGDGVETIPFYLDEVEGRDQRADLTVAIHVNWSGSGNVEQGDYLTTQSYPVDPIDGLREVIIEVGKV